MTEPVVEEAEPRAPSLLDALAPIVVLVTLLTLTIVLFGIDAANGPLQVALLTSAMFAGFVAHKNGYSTARLRDAAVGGVSSAMGAIFILLAVGALIGTWNLAGYAISPLNLLPLVLLIVFSIRQVPPFPAIMAVAIFSGILASFTQTDIVEAFVDEPGQGAVLDGIEAIYDSMANGYVSTGNETIDSLFSRGGMVSTLPTVWLILGALSFAAVMEEAGFLDRLIAPVVRRARSDASLVASVAGTSVGLNVVAGDQYVAVVLPSRVFRGPFARRGLAPRMLSRTVEDTGTVTSPLVPWNSCGAYMTGFRIEHVEAEAGDTAPDQPLLASGGDRHVE